MLLDVAIQGAFHNAQMRQAGVQLLSRPSPGSATGTVVVLTTPDANRTFMSYLGSSQKLQLTPQAESAIASTRLLIIEGYLWEMQACPLLLCQGLSAYNGEACTIIIKASKVALITESRLAGVCSVRLWAKMEGAVTSVTTVLSLRQNGLHGRTIAAHAAVGEVTEGSASAGR